MRAKGLVFCPVGKISVKDSLKNQGFRESGSQMDPGFREKTFKKQIWFKLQNWYSYKIGVATKRTH